MKILLELQQRVDCPVADYPDCQLSEEKHKTLIIYYL